MVFTNYSGFYVTSEAPLQVRVQELRDSLMIRRIHRLRVLGLRVQGFRVFRGFGFEVPGAGLGFRQPKPAM